MRGMLRGRTLLGLAAVFVYIVGKTADERLYGRGG